jgi:hypothetical protein
MESRASDSAPLCARCGSPISAGARHCGHCGLPVSAPGEQQRLDHRDRAPEPTGAGMDGGRTILESFLLGLDLLRRYPLMIAPPLIATGALFVAGVLLFGSAVGLFAAGGLAGRGPGVAGAVLGSAFFIVLFLAVAMLINLVSSGVVVVMASDALASRAPSLGGAFGRVMARLGDLVGASLLSAVIVGLAAVFLLVPGLIAGFFLLFVLPAVLLEGAGPMDSLRRSAALVRDHVGQALGLVAGMMVAGVIAWLGSMALHAIPVLGHLASIGLAGALFAYLTVVAVDVFQGLPRR